MRKRRREVDGHVGEPVNLRSARFLFSEIGLGKIMRLCTREPSNVRCCFHAIGGEHLDVLFQAFNLVHRSRKNLDLTRNMVGASPYFHLRKQQLTGIAQSPAVSDQDCKIVTKLLRQIMKPVFRLLGTGQKRSRAQLERTLKEGNVFIILRSPSSQSLNAMLMQDVKLHGQSRNLVNKHSSNYASVPIPYSNHFQMLLLGNSSRLSSYRGRLARRAIGEDCNECCCHNCYDTDPHGCPSGNRG